MWRKQTSEELLKYKLPNVFDEVPEDGIVEEDREYYPVLTVLEYFRLLFKLLGEKLLMNVPRAEKQDLDLKKWIWSGDAFAEPRDSDSAAKAHTKNSGVQTPEEWMANVLQAFDSRQGNNRFDSRKPSHQVKKPPKNAQVQTGEELIENLFLIR